MAQIRATSPADAFWTLDPFALINPRDPWHSEIESRFKPARYGLVPQLTRRLRPSPSAPAHVHIGVVGHKGTGKTTQVRKAMADLAAAGVHAVFVDALATLDQSDLSFADVILVITSAVVSGLSEAEVEVPREESELVKKLGDRKQVDAAVLHRADELRQLRSHLVPFFDPADQYAPVTVQPSQAFDTIIVPMLPIRERSDAADYVDAAALAAVRDLLDRRVDLDRVSEPAEACVREAARMSGGRLRDVFALARLACELADPDKVTHAHFEAAARKLRGERVVAAKPSQWARLAEIHRDKQVANDENDAHLLLHSLVLNYDGDPWWDVHPLVRLDERFDRAWQSLSPLRTGANPS